MKGLLWVVGGIAVLAALMHGGGKHAAPAAAPVTTSAVVQSTATILDRHTRYYANEMSACVVAVGNVFLGIRTKTDVEVAGDATDARDICDSVRSKLALADTTHFYDQAALGFYAVDRYTSGLDGLLRWIDDQRPTELIAARDKLRDADQSAATALRQMNTRRHVYGLRPYKP